MSNIQELSDAIMEEWKRIPATTCAALVNSMPRRIKAVLDNNGAPTIQSGPFSSSIFITIKCIVSVGGMVLFWATLHTPVHAAMLGQSGESSKTNPPWGTEQNHYEHT